MTETLARRRILLVIGGGIAAYKALDLIRRLRERGASVCPVLTAGAQEFVTPLAAAALAGERAHTDLFDRAEEADIGHIKLARQADAVVVAPATANLMARMAGGHAADLATTILLATTLPILIAPAMNVQMWAHPATRRNRATLEGDGVRLVGPNAGKMAEAETGPGRMAEPNEIADALERMLEEAGAEAPGLGFLSGRPGTAARPLAGRRVLVTSGPTHEPIDPVRYLANRSSGRQGHAIAAAAAEAGATVTLVSGPVAIPDPAGVRVVRVETAREMLVAVEAALPVDIAVFAAAVADWRPEVEAGSKKIKKDGTGPAPLPLVENPDILSTVSHLEAGRPPLVVGFAAETDTVLDHARAKIARKGCDLIVANDVSAAGGVMGGTDNTVHLIHRDGAMETWPRLGKDEVARRLVVHLAGMLTR
ncbi:bifunctional phosphopantothenoylcysteine decarboxylase/phosphopantothenate--cysteine ligase CoaBC [Methylobacterium brachiatum]|jgi:phosphopantothenoylcysteine decarboxylase/phosphopantothenate--cysteine ligase|uniref:Coenzyme A biosynthesis bifunctional protein CoaBC n=1 Tax=Methylobacterium brachiatum TaxID=269660 RepID=A0AAJ1WZ34_9HYPH|nr:bifunctional phosphopantothenoylcysteine decarboxylase/phosphopantothenate--cysteine ligase CoaBC [Methylobacterium brachiatum]AYO82648.1 bifunctional phosphopantothenoylcysteine decarboxylase/phosphopantothenate--cysteine ligase CoaBC [Methylobacterium brachiatum]MCB4804931.1 bifunctional phosphopantothenoylcysteine decarboxylase/phosphopantothenate--cysteine ligase CoaBC [Methylobacterium brachiatum]MDQ0545970.1 phosphopantothenoylcysteine decarboxylase/phosphopantothenate--cysteine ligase 